MQMKIDSFKNHLASEKRFSPHTIRAYIADIDQCLQYLDKTYGFTYLSELSHTHLRSWVVHLVSMGNQPRTTNRKICSIRSYMKFLMRSGLITKNPACRLRSLRLPKRLPVHLQEQETQRLLAGENDMQCDYPSCRDAVIIQTLYFTGMRRSELINLMIEDVDQVQMHFRVTGKGGKMRLIPFSKKYLVQLQRYLEIREDSFGALEGPLFLTNRGTKIYPKMVYNLVRKRLSVLTTLTQKGPHTLRHSFATHLSNAGADLNAIKELLGHANLSATQIYTHNSIEKLKTAYAKAHPKSGA